MAERIRRKSRLSSLSRLEQWALVGTILVWIGVMLFGGGLYVALRNRNAEQAAFSEATEVALTTPDTAHTVTGVALAATELSATATSTPTPTETSPVFPAGWATATPTVTPTPTFTPSATPRPTRPPEEEVGMVLDPAAFPTPTPTADARTTKTPQPTTGPSAGPPATNPPDRLIIPTIDLDSPITPVGWHTIEENGSQYSVWEVVDKVVGWHKTSAYPGHSGNVVLNGHHNIRGEVFRYLVDLEIGDTVLVYVGDQVYYYEVEQKHILKEKGESIEVRRQNAAWIAPTAEEQLTMVTCWPYTNNTHRLVVVAKPDLAPESSGIAE